MTLISLVFLVFISGVGVTLGQQQQQQQQQQGGVGEVGIHGPSDTAMQVNGETELLCQVYVTDRNGSERSPVTQPFNVTWYFKPHNSNISRVVLTFHSDKGTNWTRSANNSKYQSTQKSAVGLRIMHGNLSDAGLYTCHLDAPNQQSDGYGAHVMVIDTPYCFNENKDVDFRQNITLHCSIRYRGYIKPIVYWRMGRMKLNSTTEHINSTFMNETLRLKASEHMNGYLYHCHVEYVGLLQIECPSYPLVKVYKPPKITSLHVTPVFTRVHTRIPLGASVRLQCTADGFPYPTYSFHFRPWSNPSSRRELSSPDLSESRSSYNISSFQVADQGTYICLAMNEIKDRSYYDTKNVTLVLQEVPYTQPYPLGGGGQTWDPKPDDNDDQPSETDSQNPISPYAIAAVISATLAGILIVVFIVLAMRMKKRDRKMREKLARAHDETLDDQEVELLDETIQPNGHYMPAEYSRLKMSWEIPRKDVRLLEQIGRGAFTEVWKGRMRRTPGTNDIIRIVVKKLDSEATEQERHFFTTQLEVMKMLPAHPNIVRLVGSYTTNEPWLLMLEVAQEGTLLEYLQRHRPGQQEIVMGRGGDEAVFMRKQTLTAQKLLCLIAQVASGLEHLQKFKLIYYRLQCSRVLVTKAGVCKLYGFGFPQEMADRNAYQQSSAPVRWMAPESLVDSVYNVKTDVWSLGILMWEVLHFGLTPWPHLAPQEVLESVHTGKRMSPPPHCSKALYNLMTRCWMALPDDRPTYDSILDTLSRLVTEADQHVQFTHLPAYLHSLDGGADGDGDEISHA
ncbi:uncharacterized protein LOC143291439 isoform X2 [Babylonia areolata]|uniref:uncharacterized protein LOC143291439 isoform X2 n=1 Tax=Babylonia areolata TaxID=304850 RepID=UPI003FD66C15